MVKFATTFAAAMALALPALTVADACNDGLVYCGYNLLKKGKYWNEIVAELERVGQPADETHINQSYFQCGAGGHGWIRYIGYCSSGCVDGGKGKSDFC